MDFHGIWQRAKHGSVSEQETQAAEAALRRGALSVVTGIAVCAALAAGASAVPVNVPTPRKAL